jgi:hypothetical protein
MDVTRSLFDQFVFKVAVERGLDQLKQCQMEAISPLLARNTDHSVYYVTSQNPN